MNSDVFLIASAIGGTITAIVKTPALIRAPREGRRTLLPLCVGALFCALAYLFEAPDFGQTFDRAVSVNNIASVLVFTFSIGVAGCAQLIAINWRHDATQARRRTRPIMISAAVVLAAMWTLYLLTPPLPERHPRMVADFAREPLIGALLMIYFVAFCAGQAEAAYQCRRGALEAPEDKRWLRQAMNLFALGLGVPVLYGLISIVAVAVSWTGVDTSFWSLYFAVGVASLDIPIFVAAVTIFVWGPKLPAFREQLHDIVSSARAVRQLRPLRRVLSQVDPSMRQAPRSLAQRFSPTHLLLLQVIEMLDWLLRLLPLYSPELDDIVARRGAAAGLSAEDIDAAQHAAQVRLAVESVAAAPSQPLPVVTPTSTATSMAFASEQRRLIRISQALHTSVVDDALDELALPVPGPVTH
jgi:hypothetical protein